MFKISRALMDFYICAFMFLDCVCYDLFSFSQKKISTLYYLECNVLRNPLRIALKFLMKITPHGKANPRPNICT